MINFIIVRKKVKKGFALKVAKFSRIGFILAATGSAVGLGNIWKFPYITGEHGGGAFVLIYLLTVLLIGVTIFIGEMLVGYLGQNDAVSSFEKLSPPDKKGWKYSGFSFLTAFFILTFYPIVIAWIIYYIFQSFSLPDTMAISESNFIGFLQNDIVTQISFFTIVMLMIAYTIARGVKSGIEKLNLYMIPLLLFILIGMFLYTLSLDGFAKAFHFMFDFNFDKLQSESIIVAVGHAFFTLSIGMATILTYSSSLGKNTNLFKTSLTIAFLDTFIAIIAGLVIFAFLFEYGQEPSKGAGLVFIILPKVFHEIGSLGSFLSLIFFFALLLASLTSAISILEPVVQYMISRFKYSRIKSVVVATSIAYLIGIFALLSNTKDFSQSLTVGSKNLFDWFDFISSSIMLPLGGLIVALFIGYIIPKDRLEANLKGHMGDTIFAIWLFSIRYIAPLAVGAVMINELI